MESEVAIGLAIGTFIAAIWILMALSWGFVHKVEEDGVVLLTLLLTRRFVRWTDIDPDVQEFDSFIPRLIFRRKNVGPLTVHKSFAVILRRRTLDEKLLKEVQRRFRVTLVKNLKDLF